MALTQKVVLEKRDHISHIKYLSPPSAFSLNTSLHSNLGLLPQAPSMQPNQIRAQQSLTSLSRYAPPRTNGLDPFHGYENRDFCNAFWGPADTGPNVLFARMRGAEKTIDELRNFWHERRVSVSCLSSSLWRVGG